MTLEAEIGRIEAEMHAAGWAAHTSLLHELQAWGNLAAEVASYEATIDDYTNDLCSRDYIAEFSAASPVQVQEYIASEVATADDHFKAFTVPDVEGLVGRYFKIDKDDGW